MLHRRRGNRILLFTGQKTKRPGEFKAGALSLLLQMLNKNSNWHPSSWGKAAEQSLHIREKASLITHPLQGRGASPHLHQEKSVVSYMSSAMLPEMLMPLGETGGFSNKDEIASTVSGTS